MFEEKSSLCLTVESANKTVYLLRVADYVNGELVPFSAVQGDTSNNALESIYTVPTIGVAPRETKVGELCIWRWQPRENEPNKQNSYRTTIPFWCLAISSEAVFGVWDKNDVVKVLRSGFTIPLNLPDSFLLKVWEGKDDFRVIYLLKKDLIIFENKARLPDSADAVKCFEISKNDFFTVDDKRISSLLQRNQASTVFYKFTELPENFEILPVKTFEEQLILFFNTYAKLHNASRKERNAAKELLSDFIRNKDDINDFFAKLGHYDEKTVNAIAELEATMNEFITENGSANRIVAAMAENISALREKYIQYIRDEWLSEKDEERTRIETDLYNKTQELEKAISEYKRICEEKQIIELTVADLNIEKNELERQVSDFQKSFEEKIARAREEIADFLAEVAVYQGSVRSTNTADVGICRFVSELRNNQYYQTIEEINDLLSLLEENFFEAGVMSKYIRIAAQYVACCILSARPLLIIGCNARSFANALSATLCALPADVLTLPASFKSALELRNAVDESKSDVILIENAVLGCDENIYLPLIKGESKKWLLFSVDFEDNMAMLPKSILHFMNLIDLDLISESVKDESYKFGRIINGLPVLGTHDDKIYRYRKILKEFAKAVGLSSIYIHQRSDYLAKCEAINGRALTTLLVCELIPYFMAQGKLDEIEEFINDLQLSDNELKLIEDIMPWK